MPERLVFTSTKCIPAGSYELIQKPEGNQQMTYSSRNHAADTCIRVRGMDCFSDQGNLHFLLQDASQGTLLLRECCHSFFVRGVKEFRVPGASGMS